MKQFIPALLLAFTVNVGNGNKEIHVHFGHALTREHPGRIPLHGEVSSNKAKAFWTILNGGDIHAHVEDPHQLDTFLVVYSLGTRSVILVASDGKTIVTDVLTVIVE